MLSLAAIAMSAALAGPNGLQVLHSAAAEDSQQRQMLDRLRDAGTPAIAPRSHLPQSPADGGHDAAWRADHLTCTSHRGRTREQYQSECAAWAAEQAAREAAAR